MSDETLLLPPPEERKLLPAPRGTAGGPPSGDRQPGKPPADPKRIRRVVLIALVVLAVLVAIGWFLHHRRDAQAKEAAERERDRLPTVGTIVAAASPPIADLRLPATITPLNEASLFARASGYLKVRYADIGDTVRRGQVLAEIDAPDLDQQVAMAREQVGQARSAVDDAKARVDLSQVTFNRLSNLVGEQAVSRQQFDQGRQDLDTAKAGLASSNANAAAAQANLARFAILQDYEKVRAPFDGIVTARNVDVGALVNGVGASSASSTTSGVPMTSSGGASSGSASAGSTSTTMPSGGGSSTTGGAATELFRVAQADRVRVFVTVPQENAGSVELDTDASVSVQGFEKPFDGRVTRTANAFDPSARTLLVEVQVANPRRLLVPGMYAQVRFRSPRQGSPLLVPGEAVIARSDGLYVAAVEELRDEDRQRLPKQSPKAKDEGKGEGKDGAKDDKKGDDGKGKAAKSGGGAGAGDSKKGEKDDGAAKGGDDGPVDDDPAHAKRIAFRKVEVGRDYGVEIEITGGLAAGATIVANPGDETEDGTLVIPRPREPAGGGAKDGAGKDAAKGRPPPVETDGPAAGIQSPSRQAPTKGRK